MNDGEEFRFQDFEIWETMQISNLSEQRFDDLRESRGSLSF